MNAQINPAILAAETDYRPDLVRVNEGVILSTVRPAQLGAMGSALGESPLAVDPAHYVPYYVAMNTMNWMFWEVASEGTLERYARNGLIGALAMQNGFHEQWRLEHAAGEGSPAVVAETLKAKVSALGVDFLFGRIPDPQGRRDLLIEVLDAKRLNQVSGVLTHKLLTEHRLTWRDAQMLAEEFPLSYGDRYLKKAQLTLMFIAAEWNAKMPEHACTLDVSMAADYQVPKVMRSSNFIVYGEEVDYLVKTQSLIPANSAVERAIRAATIKAGRLLSEHLKCPDEELDFYFWANRNVARDALFHLTKTTNY